MSLPAFLESVKQANGTVIACGHALGTIPRGIAVAQEGPGFYWQLQDPAGLRFSHADGDPPTHLRCYSTSNHCNVADQVSVPLADLTFLASARFGDGRPGCSSTRWTGDHYKYALYEHQNSYHRHEIVLVENHGGGMFCYLFHSLVSVGLWTTLAKTLTREQLWDVCHEFATTYNHARSIEHRSMAKAFLDGRMKKRRRNGATFMHLDMPTEEI